MSAEAKMRPASNSRRRYRKTADLAAAIVAVLDDYPTFNMSTRQVYYQCVSRGVVDNCVAGYEKVQRLVVELRRDGVIPYDRIVDRTRAKHQRAGWDGAEEIIRACGQQFRRNLWATQDTVVMIGLEKQALEGVFAEAVDEYGASLWTLHGYGSESFMFEWATEIKAYNDDGKVVEVYYFGDHDPTGLDIERDAIEKLEAHGADFEWSRSGLKYIDLVTYDLVNVPVKTGDTRSKNYLEVYGDSAAELDALPPDELQQRIRSCIDEHIDHEERERILRNEELERESLRLVAGNWKKAVAAAGGGK